MSTTPFQLIPMQRTSTVSGGAANKCLFAANCSCVFSRGQADQGTPVDAALHSEATISEVARWTDQGWTITSADAHQVVLERRPNLSFCLNLALCLVTGSLWLIYWIPRLRNPKIETKVLTLPFDEGRDVANSFRDAFERV